jgi:methionyl-tRNA formyltransferase
MTGPAGKPLRVALLGNDAWSVPPLEALAAGTDPPTLVITRDPRPGGRGRSLRPTPVAEAARRLGLPLVETSTVRFGEGFRALASSAPDVLVVVAYGEILPAEVLDLPRLAPVNLHFSLLPAFRGAAPVQRAILEGMTTTGVTVMEMDEGLDTGPILAQAETEIGPEEDAGSLGHRLAALGGALLVTTLSRLAAGDVERHPQDGHEATFAPKLQPEERAIDWSEPAERIVRRVRAFAPEPGAVTKARGRVLKILRARVHAVGWTSHPPWPGAISLGRDRSPWVGAGDRREVELLEVAPEGRKRMSGAEFIRGYRPAPGERLG